MEKGPPPAGDSSRHLPRSHFLPNSHTLIRCRSRFFIRLTKPHERDAFIAARDLADKAGLPLVPAMEDYLRARELAGTESLAAMATQYAKHFGSVVRRATVPEVVKQLVASREQDGSGRRHLVQLGSVLRRFASACPGPILVWSAEQMAPYERGIFSESTARGGRESGFATDEQHRNREKDPFPLPPQRG